MKTIPRRRFLGVAARFNAIQPCAEYADRLPHRDIAQDLTKAPATLERIWNYGCKGQLGAPLQRLCCGSRDKLPRLQRLSAELVDPITQMEVGLAHNDFYPDSTGWRRELWRRRGTCSSTTTPARCCGSVGARATRSTRAHGGPPTSAAAASARGRTPPMPACTGA